MFLRRILFTVLFSCFLVSLALASPTAYFAYDVGSGGAPLTVHFSDESTGGTISSWLWNFGDGTTSTEQNPTHIYSVPGGPYTVNLTINGGVSTATGYQIITVTTVPTANFQMNTTAGVAPLAVLFEDISTGVPVSWAWDFGDGATSTQRNVTHVYNTPGTYTVALTALDNSGQGSTKTVAQAVIVTQTAAMPITSFRVTPTSGNAPLAVLFTDTSTGVPITWQWDFGDGTGSSAKNPAHTYQYPGLYSVTLTVTNGYGSDSYTASSCVAVAGVSSIVQAGLHASINVASSTNVSFPIAVQFQDMSTGSPNNWSWSFGDGTTSNEQHPLHTYNTSGTYLVTLQVMNGTGASSVSQLNVTPAIAAPNNYSKYVSQIFTPQMTTWDFVENTKNFYLDFIPSDIFFAIILLIPFLTLYNRQGTFLMVGVLYMFTGGVIALIMPPVLAPFAFWFIILGAGGTIYRLFVTD